MKARLITRKGSFAPDYYAIAILPDNLNQEVVLQAPAWNYPSSEEDFDEGLNPTAEKFFSDLVAKINA